MYFLALGLLVLSGTCSLWGMRGTVDEPREELRILKQELRELGTLDAERQVYEVRRWCFSLSRKSLVFRMLGSDIEMLRALLKDDLFRKVLLETIFTFEAILYTVDDPKKREQMEVELEVAFFKEVLRKIILQAKHNSDTLFSV